MAPALQCPTIGRIVFRVGISSHCGNETIFIQQISLLFHDVLREELDSAFRHAPALKVERLTLPLGTFDEAGWEAELPVRLRTQLDKQINALHQNIEAGIVSKGGLVRSVFSESELTSEPGFFPRYYEARLEPTPNYLVRLILNPSRLTFWLIRLKVITLKSVATLLVDEIPVALLKRKKMAEVLPLSALVYLQRHPQIAVPNPPASLQTLPVAIHVNTLRIWLPRLMAYPLRAEVRHWLHLLCTTGEAKKCLAEALASISPTQVRTSLSPVRTDPLEVPPASTQPLPFSAPRAKAQPTPRPEPPIRTNSGMTWPIHEAGLVLLWPLLPSLFKKMGLLLDQQWVQPEGNYRAMRCLQALVWGEGPLMWGEDWPDSALLRWLCGMPLGLPLAAPDGFEDNPDDLAELDAWLARPPTAPLDNWSDFSLAELRERFLQRPGKLSLQGGRWSLEIELEPGTKTPPPVPWPVSVLSYPWLTQPLYLSFYEAASVG